MTTATPRPRSKVAAWVAFLCIALSAATASAQQEAKEPVGNQDKNPLASNTQTAIDGPALEAQFSREGIGARAHIDITKEDLYQVFEQGPLQLLFNEASQFEAPVVLREVHTGDRPGYSIDVMPAGIDQHGVVLQAVVPIGCGTVYKVFGKVDLFGNSIATDGTDPLVFVVHNARGLAELQPTLRTNGRLTTVTLYPPLKITVVQEAPAGYPTGALLQLVHVGGNGKATLKDKSEVTFQEPRH